ncbi:MAG TPA: hypothetical protein PLU83_00070, partial [Phycicoccus sp.]|nr:hypothetical protein [Phycicoccus sp.]
MVAKRVLSAARSAVSAATKAVGRGGSASAAPAKKAAPVKTAAKAAPAKKAAPAVKKGAPVKT